MMVDRVLTKLLKESSDFKVVKIDIVTHPRTALKEGIRMIPALKDGDIILSGIFLGGEEIRAFIDEARQNNIDIQSGGHKTI